MNASLKLLLVLLISLEVSFTQSLSANLILITGSLFYLMIHKTSFRSLLLLGVVPFLPALGLFVTIYYFSPDHDLHFAWVLFTRMYVYVTAGASFTLTSTPLDLALSLEQNWHLPSKFAYGTLAAFNMLPKIKSAIVTIRTAGLMRGIVLSWWSPQLYFKAILVALNWSENLAQAMISHGFVEDQPRTFYRQIKITIIDYSMLIVIILAIQLPIWLLP
ncbi:energy-coupling factor transporter transmembrane component T family protein [Paucilactobacillus kaifaensis]|uniref:energy-coupling factor transporter transmembrane component T family protein n=1 Tax=Paucilactobacillus kaifaensis TaxID=2559921 RepID=UPI0010FA00C3|nr:energy-coupling factor transporter transmembrane component T [Paucilactobacillus kaifaensis]